MKFVRQSDSKTRSQSQKSTCKDPRRNGQARAITPEATYAPVSNRACSRSILYNPPIFL
ncbi:alpha-galactosidase [Lacticaseibacillus chiayiensis]|uniref:Alpha-galactosidase n=1 Tax=Lacticaseibacillus chiayiensis TaxID=2100821 RepID=A0A4Q1TND1_9LACO|nr:alpha-galactosidase [Lacticaseibacillus chiayiensis]